MKKEHFTKIIKLIKPSFTGLELGKVWYKAYFYVVPFTANTTKYKLYVDLVQDCAFIHNLDEEKEVGSIDINNRSFRNLLQTA